MQSIRSKDTKAEIALRKALWHNGYRYRKNYNKLPGRPDIALTKYKIAVFCDSEFFHGKDWDLKRKKLQNSERADFWISKIERNIERDRENEKALQFLGWSVLRFWAKDILKDTAGCIKTIEELIIDQCIETGNN